MTKDQFIQELKMYLYNNCKDYSKDEIDEGLLNRSNWIQGYINFVGEKDEFNSMEEALEKAKKDFKLVFSKLTYDEFKDIIINKLVNDPSNTKTQLEIEDIITNEPQYIEYAYKKAKESEDYFHAINRAFYDYYYGWID